MWILGTLAGCGDNDPAGAPRIDNPGLVVVHRLNRAEYDNTVRDLFATAQRPASQFPADDFTLGFSNISDILSISPTHIELYEIAADSLLEEISSHRIAPTTTLRLEAEAATGAGTPFGSVRNLFTPGEVLFSAEVPTGGTWELALTATAEPPAELEISANGESLGRVLVGTSTNEVVPVELLAGTQPLTLALTDPGNTVVQLDLLSLTGPIGVTQLPGPGRDGIFTCDPAEIGEPVCAEEIVSGFGQRAWRRPLTRGELDRAMGLYGVDRASGGDWEEAVLLALKGMLLAPQFVYRWELDADPASDEPRPLDGYELASRLSYFLWSSMPDQELFDLAASGQILRDSVLRSQVARMLRDPKAAALVDTLGTEWLYLDRVDESTPEAAVFPDFDEGLATAMKVELDLFTSNILLNDRSMLELLTGTDTWIDAELASHYEMDLPPGDGFVPVITPDRPGIVGRAGWLTALSYPTRTSPVRRGKWVVENLMCEPSAPPPSGVVPALPGDSDDSLTQSFRDQLEQHRADPTCAGCHVVMDGIGFGLEGFDGIGRTRAKDEFGNAIDATGTLVTGISFEGAAELGAVLAADPKVPRCMVQKTFLFALGRTLRVEDLVFLDAITADFEASGYRFSALASGIATSDAFRYRLPAGGSR